MPKATRAIKITDKGKAWNKKATSSSYKIDSIPENKTILIVCEGQTEKLYFESFPVLGLSVTAIDLKGQSKTKLIESTQEIIERSGYEYDGVWCVFDMDVKRGAEEFSDFDNAIIKGNQLGYNIAYSNDSFELWFYLHYEYTDAEHLRSFYYDELGKRFNLNYVKDGKKHNFCLKLYDLLMEDEKSSQEKAIERARKLFEKVKDLPFYKQNPVTKVFELVEELNENLRR
ncbi:RloB domain-containing protein [Flavobacterium endoglycinae]|uniref:RloB domain-containing protein n=1 Tax=Flavobacterium endoglycinae TaxID=2816357 RepID=A0ABX7QBJ9_9FLAO|nr:RloB family protein [Flavobacterium endoglycinae]QSW88414.1 RloB domain-containing protein [Flavobacterium endoglycinae]